MKDILNTYMRGDETPESSGPEPVVTASTSTDINDVHVHAEAVRSESERAVDETAVIVAALQKENADLKDQVLRKVAEFENFKRRTEREKEQLALYVSERMFGKLVEVLDDLHAALDAGRKSDDYASMLSGVEMIYAKALKMYEEHGVRPLVVTENVPFNVDEHEALMHIPHPDIAEGLVVQQVQRGYKLHDKVIRHAKVITSAGNGA
ncbi:MAG: nucleotide exchange factor GrpE [Candidatus Kapaibacterium sp.]